MRSDQGSVKQTNIHTYMKTYMHAYIHTRIHTSQNEIRPRRCETNIQTYIHTFMHAYILTYIHAYIPRKMRSNPGDVGHCDRIQGP